MEVQVKLFATLREGRFRSKEIDVPEGSTAGDVLRELGIGPQEVAILIVNGQSVTAERPLRGGDAMSLFPAVAGG